MNREKSHWRARWGPALLACLPAAVFSVLAAGCCSHCGGGGLWGHKDRTPDWIATNKLYHGPEQCPRLVQGSLPDPNGAFVRRFQTVQSVNAEMTDFVFFRHEWYLNGIELGPYGKYHLDQIIKRLHDVPFPVLIQIDVDVEKNQKRRERIVEALALAGHADADQRVILGFPAAEGMFGEEIEPTYARLLATAYGNFFPAYPGAGFGSGGFGGFGGYGGFVPTLPGVAFP